jgi:hypothetical protein
MARLKVNYGRIDFAGRLMFAMIFALSPAILFYKVFGTKVGAVLIFISGLRLVSTIAGVDSRTYAHQDR